MITQPCNLRDTLENDSSCELEIWYNRPTQSNSGNPQRERYTHYGERNIVKNKENTI